MAEAYDAAKAAMMAAGESPSTPLKLCQFPYTYVPLQRRLSLTLRSLSCSTFQMTRSKSLREDLAPSSTPPSLYRFAIYIPLFLPISIPIVLSSITALKWALASLRRTEKLDS